MKREIVKMMKMSGPSHRQIMVECYAIRRKVRTGLFKTKWHYEYLKLREMDTVEWKKKESFSMDSTFYNNFTVESLETIKQKWNFKPKTKQQLENEIYGTPVDLKLVFQEYEDTDEDTDNRLNRLGVN